MSYDFKRKMFNTGTGIAGTTIVVPHGMSVAPKFLMFSWSGRVEAVDTAGQDNSHRGASYVNVVGAAEYICVANVAQDNVALGVARPAKAVMKNNCAILMLSTAGVEAGRASVQSVDATNITLLVDQQFSRSLRVQVAAQGGTEITNVKVGTFAMPTAGTAPYDMDVTAPGFTVSDNLGVAMFLGCKSTALNTIKDDSELMFGAAVNATDQRVALQSGDSHLTNTTTVRYSTPAEAVASFNANDNSMSGRLTFKQFITNGFRFTVVQNSFQASLIGYALIKGPKTALKAVTGTGTSGSNVVVTGLGFLPVGGILIGTGVTSTAGTSNTKDTGFVGAWDGVASQGVHAWFDANIVATSKTFTRVDHDACWLHLGDTGANDGSSDGAMKLLSIQSDGCTYQGMEAGHSGTFMNLFFAPSAGGGLPAGPINRTLVVPANCFSGNDLYLPVLSKGHDVSHASVSVTDNDTVSSNLWIKLLESADRTCTLWWKRATANTAGKVVTVSGGITSMALGLTVYGNTYDLDDADHPHTNLFVSTVVGAKTIGAFTPLAPFSRVVLIVFNRSDGPVDIENPFCTNPGELDTEFLHKALAGGGCSILLASTPATPALLPATTGAFTWESTIANDVAMTFAVRPRIGNGEGWTTTTFVDSETTQQQSIELPLFGTNEGLIYTLDPSQFTSGGFWLSGVLGKEHEDTTIDRVRVVATAAELATVGVSFTFDGGLTYTDEIIVIINPAVKGSYSASGWGQATGQLFQVRVRHLAGNAIVHEINLMTNKRGRSA